MVDSSADVSTSFIAYYRSVNEPSHGEAVTQDKETICDLRVGYSSRALEDKSHQAVQNEEEADYYADQRPYFEKLRDVHKLFLFSRRHFVIYYLVDCRLI